jgi:hypothetical protein
MTEQINKLPARPDSGADNILKHTVRSQPLLKYKKRKFYLSDDEVRLGHEYIADPMNWQSGWIQWKDGVPVKQLMVRIADGKVPAERKTLSDTDETKWEDGEDPWQPQNVLPLEDAETGEFVLFVGTSLGAKIAIERLASRVARDIKAGRDRGLPRIKLAIGQFNTKEYGKVDRPDFVIVGWEHEHEPDAGFRPLSEKKPIEKMPIGTEVDDEIPF